MTPRKVDPVITTILVGLVVFALGFWGYRSKMSTGHPVGKVERTRAKLSDGVCVFAADVELVSGFGKMEFDRHRMGIREALVDILRRKSSYMVDNPVARAALRSQMVNEVNRIAQKRIPLRLTSSEFDL